jgi:predicted DNA-binding protein (UPF0251 family)
MLKQVHLLNTSVLYAEPNNPKPLTKGMYIFPNCETGALMGVEYPLELEQQVKVLLRQAHKERELSRPTYTMSRKEAAKRLGIKQSVLQSWVKKGWIYCWPNWVVIENWPLQLPYPPSWASDESRNVVVSCETLFSELEVEALRLVKPRDL